MSFKLLTISSLYIEFLKSYNDKNKALLNTTYREHLNHLLENTSEPVGSYTRMFNKLGIDADCIIDNADFLQKKWQSENLIKPTNSKRLVFEQVKSFKPDILWLENIDFTDNAWIKYVRSNVPEIKLIIANHCAPYNTRIIENFKSLNFVLTCTPGLKDNFERNGLSAYSVYHAFNREILNKIGNDNPFPVNNFIFSGSLFMGGGYHDKRLELIESILKENIDIKIYGNLEKCYKIKAKQTLYHTYRFLNYFKMTKSIQNISFLKKHEEYSKNRISKYSKNLVKSTNSPIFGLDMFKLLKNAKITLNIHGEVAGDYAGNMRLFEATGVGSCLLTDDKRNMSDLFVADNEVILYDSYSDCIEKVKWLLEHESERKNIALAGQERTLKTHTVEDRCRQIIDILNKELAK